MEIDRIKEMLSKELNTDRFNHSVNVMAVSEALAKHYGADAGKAALAGLLHDCGKNCKGDSAREYIRRIGYEADSIEWSQTHLLHGVIGAHLAMEKYGVEDPEVLSAVRWHITGRAGMTLLEKIVYVADYIEPSRCCKKIERLRKEAYVNLEKCIVLCSDSTIEYILGKGELLHPKTVETRNYGIISLNGNE